MKLASTIPFKAALLAASITTIGIVALAIHEPEVVPVPDHCELRHREPAPPIPEDPVQPKVIEIDPAPMPPASF